MELRMAMNWPTLRRKLLAGLIAVGLAYSIGYYYYWPGVDRTDPVRTLCAGIETGMPIAQAQADAVVAELSTILGARKLRVYSFRTDHRAQCLVTHREGFVTAVKLVVTN